MGIISSMLGLMGLGTKHQETTAEETHSRRTEQGARPARVSDVFSERALPALSFVDRSSTRDKIRYLQTDLRKQGMIVCVHGPSKMGKSTFLRKYSEQLDVEVVKISGSEIQNITQFWNQVAIELGLQEEVEIEVGDYQVEASGTAFTAEAEINAGFARGDVQGTGAKGAASGSHKTVRGRQFGTIKSMCVDALKKETHWVIVDDFHLSCRGSAPDFHEASASKRLRREIFESVKDVAEETAIKFVFVAIPKEAISPHIRADLSIDDQFVNRVSTVEFPTWNEEELIAVPTTGFQKLGIKLPQNLAERIAKSSLGSPFNCQSICEKLCYNCDVDEVDADARSNLEIKTTDVNRAIGDFIKRQDIYRIYQRLILNAGDARGVTVRFDGPNPRQVGLSEAIVMGLAKSYVHSEFGLRLEKLKQRIDALFPSNSWNEEHLANRLKLMTAIELSSSVSSSDEFVWNRQPLIFSPEDRKVYLVDPGLSMFLSHEYQDQIDG